MLKTVFTLLLVHISTASLGESFEDKLVAAALERTQHSVRYDGSYIPITYPNGDIPNTIGVCTDVLIRTYRSLGIDLQRLVHEDMATHFEHYPSRRIWGLVKPDPNIDHRRVPNLQHFFTRQGTSLPVTRSGSDYKPGEIVTWMLPGNLPHIGIVSNRVNPRTGSPLIIHNIGAGPGLEDMLFHYPITGHYHYSPQDY
jgi:uncharacterized protein YijF (DUF1287 family)